MNTSRFLWSMSVSALLVLSCSACGTVYEGKYARDDGWRRGTIQELAAAADIKHVGWRDCRKELSSAQLAVSQFATVEFFGSHRVSTITVPVQDEKWHRGDHVYVDIAHCSAALQPRGQD